MPPPHFENGYAVVGSREGKEGDLVIDTSGRAVYMAPEGFSIIAFNGNTVELAGETGAHKHMHVDLDHSRDAQTLSGGKPSRSSESTPSEAP